MLFKTPLFNNFLFYFTSYQCTAPHNTNSSNDDADQNIFCEKRSLKPTDHNFCWRQTYFHCSMKAHRTLHSVMEHVTIDFCEKKFTKKRLGLPYIASESVKRKVSYLLFKSWGSRKNVQPVYSNTIIHGIWCSVFTQKFFRSIYLFFTCTARTESSLRFVSNIPFVIYAFACKIVRF